MRVVVVGAGLAGLAAARRLVADGHDPVVLEARARVGGRTEGAHLDDGTPLELGGQWLGKGHERMYQLVEELGLETFRTYNDEGEVLVQLRGRTTRMGSQKGAVPRVSPFVLADLAQAALRFERLARRVDVEQPWRTPKAEVYDGLTWETWLRRNVRTRAARAYFQLAAEGVWAVEPADVSLLHALFYTRSNADLETLLGVDEGAQQGRVVGGSVLVAERMAAELGERVRLESPVRRIEQHASGVRVHTRDSAGREAGVHEGAAVVVALPPTLAGRLEYAPALPAARDQLVQRFAAGSVIKTYAVYPEPFWRAEGLNGQAASDVGPVKITFDNSPPSGSPGVLMGFIEANEARSWGRRSLPERRAAVLGCFARYFGDQAARPTAYLERDWMAEEYTRGCYGAHFAPGAWTAFGEAWRAPVGRVHWAGAESSPLWNGYMEGAVRSGEAAAAAVVREEFHNPRERGKQSS